MKGCYVVSEWIGMGREDDPQRPRVADEYPCYCQDVTGQFVRLSDKSPDPNLAVFRVAELRSPKHDGRIEAIKVDSRFCVLEEWDVVDMELPFPRNEREVNILRENTLQSVSDKDVGTYLQERGVKKAVRDLVKGEHRVGRARKLFKDFERKAVTPI